MVPDGARDLQHQAEILLRREATDRHDHHVPLGHPWDRCADSTRHRRLTEHGSRYRSQPGVAGHQRARLGTRSGAGTEREICASTTSLCNNRPRRLMTLKREPRHARSPPGAHAGAACAKSNRPGFVAMGVHDITQPAGGGGFSNSTSANDRSAESAKSQRVHRSARHGRAGPGE